MELPDYLKLFKIHCTLFFNFLSFHFRRSIVKSHPSSVKKSSPLSHSAHSTPATIVTERVQKVLARGGIASRRQIEQWIQQQRLQINDQIVHLGQTLQVGDRLYLDGRLIHWEAFFQQPTQVLVYNKPVGEVVTRRDPEGRPTVFDRLPKLANGRWIAIGRLDVNTSGLLLLTNNGELANRLMHPSRQVDREYAVRILGEVSDESLIQLKQGVELEDGIARFCDIQFFDGKGVNKWYHVVVNEGRNRLVRRLWESQHLVVSRLMRVRYGTVILPTSTRAQDFHLLNADDLATLMEFVGLTAEKPQVVKTKVADKSSERAKSSKIRAKSVKESFGEWTYKTDAVAQAKRNSLVNLAKKPLPTSRPKSKKP